MNRASRSIISVYLAVVFWLGFCTVATFGDVPAWSTATMAAASAAPILGAIRELDLRDTRRHLAVLKEREARQAAHADEAAEHQANAELLDACCERWWTSCGTDHDDTCPHHTPRSNAA
ncbi:hypothetical protein [Streptomyces spinosirectus]